MKKIYQSDNNILMNPPTWLPEEYHEWWKDFSLYFPFLISQGWKFSIPVFKGLLKRYHYEVYKNIFGEWRSKFDRIEEAKKYLKVILSPYISVDNIRTRDVEIVVILEEDDEYIRNITPQRIFGVNVNFQIGEDF